MERERESEREKLLAEIRFESWVLANNHPRFVERSSIVVLSRFCYFNFQPRRRGEVNYRLANTIAVQICIYLRVSVTTA